MDYKETVEFLFSRLPAYHRIGKDAYKNNLDNIIKLDNFLGQPHKKFDTIHVAGTNGKGSVSHLTASVLMEAGYKTGLYTSPHLTDFRERIRVNGKMIKENDVINFVSENMDMIDLINPSFFEITVAMAFSHFAGAEVDVAVIEVGLGGRLDSTNIIKPVLSIITNIGHDHMDLLGNTLEKVASEKAGIIKKNVQVVISETQPDLKDIFIEKAAENLSEISFADQNFHCVFEEHCFMREERNYRMSDLVSGKSYHGKMALTGDYQVKNMQAVFQSFKTLQNFYNVSDDAIVAGIRNVVVNTGIRGRWQILGRDPLMICDTCHNMEGLMHVLKQIRSIPVNKVHFVIGFVNDKDLSLILPLFPGDGIYYFTRASVPRALDEKVLMNKAKGYGLKGDSYPDVKTALENATKNASPSDLIFIGGSSFIVAEVI